MRSVFLISEQHENESVLFGSLLSLFVCQRSALYVFPDHFLFMPRHEKDRFRGHLFVENYPDYGCRFTSLFSEHIT